MLGLCSVGGKDKRHCHRNRCGRAGWRCGGRVGGFDRRHWRRCDQQRRRVDVPRASGHQHKHRLAVCFWGAKPHRFISPASTAVTMETSLELKCHSPETGRLIANQYTSLQSRLLTKTIRHLPPITCFSSASSSYMAIYALADTNKTYA